MRTAFVILLMLAACGPKPDETDAGTQVPDAGCDLNAGDSYQGGAFIDAGWSVEWEQQCSRPPNPLRPGFGINAFCTTANGCQQVSCECPSNPAKRFAARGCDGLCRDIGQTCGWTISTEPRLCQ